MRWEALPSAGDRGWSWSGGGPRACGDPSAERRGGGHEPRREEGKASGEGTVTLTQKEYVDELERLQIELLFLQEWIQY
jgi:hypothetical protein